MKQKHITRFLSLFLAGLLTIESSFLSNPPVVNAQITTEQLQTALAESQAAEKEMQSARAAYDAVKREYDEKAAADQKAQAAYQTAVQNKTDAEAALQTAQKKLDTAKQYARDCTEEKISDALAAKNIAETSLNTAKEAESNAKSAYEAAQEELKKAKDDLADAQAALAAAQKSEAGLKTEYDEAKEAFTQAQTALNAVQSEQNDLAQAIGPAQQALSSASNTLTEKTSTYNTLKSNEATLKTAAETAQAKKDQGSAGFFKEVGSSDAADVFNTCTYASYVKVYGKNGVTLDEARKSATALDNMAETFQWIKECNSLRQKHGLAALKVCDMLMAYGQACADYSDKAIAHSSQFNVGENLAWGYRNPFDGWYTKEKELYDKAVAEDPSLAQLSAYNLYVKNPTLYNKVGHYLNIIDPDYIATGFAISRLGQNSYGKTDAQEFGQEWNFTYGNKPSTTLYTVEEYETRFNNYLSQMQNDISAYTNYAPNLAKAKSEMEQASSAKEEATQTLASLQAKQTPLKEKEAQLQSAFNTADSAYTRIKGSYETAQNEVTQKEQDVKTFRTLVTQKEQNSVSQNSVYTAAVQNTEQKQEAYQTAYERWDGYANATENLATAETALQTARTQKEKAVLAEQSAKKSASQTARAAADARSALLLASGRLQDAQSRYDTAFRNYTVLSNSYALQENGTSSGEIGKRLYTSSAEYVILSADEVSLARYTKTGARSIAIPALILYQGRNYKVTKIESNAFSGTPKMKTLTIGSNVKYIEKNAFPDCRKLTKIVVNTSLLTSNTVRKKAFKNLKKKVTVRGTKMSKKQLNTLKKALKKAGLPGKTIYKR